MIQVNSKLDPFLHRIAMIVCQNDKVDAVNGDYIEPMDDDTEEPLFFYLGSGYWRCIVHTNKQGKFVRLINPGMKGEEVNRIQEAVKIIINNGIIKN